MSKSGKAARGDARLTSWFLITKPISLNSDLKFQKLAIIICNTTEDIIDYPYNQNLKC